MERGPKKIIFFRANVSLFTKKSLKYLQRFTLDFDHCTFKQNIMEEDRTLLFTCFQVEPLTTVRLISNGIWREAIPNQPGS